MNTSELHETSPQKTQQHDASNSNMPTRSGAQYSIYDTTTVKQTEEEQFRANTSRYIKLVNKNEKHHGMTFHLGLNVDPVPFQTDRICAAGGIYFTKADYFSKWFYDFYAQWYIYDVTIPDDAQTFIEPGFKMKADKVILENRQCIYDVPELCLAAVKRHGWALQFVKEQTPEICFAAVTQDGYALQFVKEQTPELCFAAVAQNELALRFVKEQTPEICLFAVTQYGCALQYVKEQTPEICLTAVTQYGCLLSFVNEQTPEICLAAVKDFGCALRFVKEQTPEICLTAITQNGCAMSFVKEQTPEICFAAVTQK